MRRRPRIGDRNADPLPPELETYRPQDWPEHDCHPECAYLAAVSAWLDERPDWTWPPDWHLIDEPWHPERI